MYILYIYIYLYFYLVLFIYIYYVIYIYFRLITPPPSPRYKYIRDCRRLTGKTDSDMSCVSAIWRKKLLYIVVFRPSYLQILHSEI